MYIYAGYLELATKSVKLSNILLLEFLHAAEFYYFSQCLSCISCIFIERFSENCIATPQYEFSDFFLISISLTALASLIQSG